MLCLFSDCTEMTMTERNRQKNTMKRKDATKLLDGFNSPWSASYSQSHQEIQVIAMLCWKTACRHAHSLCRLIGFQSVVSEEVNSVPGCNSTNTLGYTHSDSWVWDAVVHISWHRMHWDFNIVEYTEYITVHPSDNLKKQLTKSLHQRWPVGLWNKHLGQCCRSPERKFKMDCYIKCENCNRKLAGPSLFWHMQKPPTHRDLSVSFRGTAAAGHGEN